VGLLLIDRILQAPIGSKVISNLTNPYAAISQEGRIFKVGNNSFIIGSENLCHDIVDSLRVHEVSYKLNRLTANIEITNLSQGYWFFMGSGLPPENIDVTISPSSITARVGEDFIQLEA
jgi:hypothetical protein